MGGLNNEYSGSMGALPDHRRDAEFGSRYSLPVDTAYRGSSLERGDHRKSQPSARGSLHNSSPIHEHTSKRGTTTSTSNKGKAIKPNVAESYSSNSSDSDDD
jgi:hypothetical protein